VSASYTVRSGWQFAYETDHEDFEDALRAYKIRRGDRYGAVLLGKDADYADDSGYDGLTDSERERLDEP
jgi:hypothetical protein